MGELKAVQCVLDSGKHGSGKWCAAAHKQLDYLGTGKRYTMVVTLCGSPAWPYTEDGPGHKVIESEVFQMRTPDCAKCLEQLEMDGDESLPNTCDSNKRPVITREMRRHLRCPFPHSEAPI